MRDIPWVEGNPVSVPASLYFNFAAPGNPLDQRMIWKLIIDWTQDPLANPSQLEVKRTGARQWVISAASARLHVDASPDGSSTNRTDEGYYDVSFKITVTE